MNDIDIAFNILKNFAMLLETVLDKVDSIPLEFLIKSIDIINTLSYRSPPHLRMKLKDTGVLEARNAYILKCLTSKFRDHDFVSHMVALCSIQSSIQNMLVSFDTKHIPDHQVIYLVLGFFIEASERINKLTSDFEQGLLLSLVEVQVGLMELIHIVVASSSECRKTLSRLCDELNLDGQSELAHSLYTNRSNIVLACMLNSFKNSTSDAWEAHLRELNLTGTTCGPGKISATQNRSWFSWSSNDAASLSDIGANVDDDSYGNIYSEMGLRDTNRQNSYDSDAESSGSQGSGRSTLSKDSFSMGFSRRNSSPRKQTRSSRRSRPVRRTSIPPRDQYEQLEDLRPYDTAAFVTWYNDIAQRYNQCILRVIVLCTESSDIRKEFKVRVLRERSPILHYYEKNYVSETAKPLKATNDGIVGQAFKATDPLDKVSTGQGAKRGGGYKTIDERAKGEVR